MGFVHYKWTGQLNLKIYFRKQNNVAEKYNAFLVMTYQWKSNYRGSNPIISAVVIWLMFSLMTYSFYRSPVDLAYTL